MREIDDGLVLITLLLPIGLERTDNNMDLSSWPQVPAINQKNYYTYAVESDYMTIIRAATDPPTCALGTTSRGMTSTSPSDCKMKRTGIA